MSGFWTRFLGPARPATILRSFRRPPPPPPWSDEVTLVDGMPVIHLRGSAAERGERQGRILGPQIEALLDHYLGGFVGVTSRERETFLRRADGLETALTQEECEEICGLSRGVPGIDPDDLRIAATFLDGHKLGACSTVVTSHGRSGEPLFGRNLDFPSFGIAHRLGIVLVQEPDGGIPHATVGWPGLLGALSGMNREGLAVALNLIYGETDAEEGVPVTFAVGRVLAGARDVEEAAGMLAATPFASSNNITVCDASGGAAVFEVGPGRFVRRPPEGGLLLATNHLVSCRSVPRPSPLSLSSHLRFHRMRAGRGALTTRAGVDEVKRALRRAAMPRITLQSMIFEPARRRLHVATGRIPAARGRFSVLDAGVLFP